MEGSQFVYPAGARDFSRLLNFQSVSGTPHAHHFVLVSGYLGLLPQGHCGRGVKLINSRRIMSSFRMRGAIHLLRHTPAWCALLRTVTTVYLGWGGDSVVWGDGRQNSATLLLRPGIINGQLSRLITQKTN